jgi:hypothetical protein
MAVVQGVLVHPPAVAQADTEVGHQHSEPVVPPPAPEDLLMAGIVAEEAELREDDRKIARDNQLPPRLTEPDQRRDAGREHGAQHEQPGHIGDNGAIQQPGLSNLGHQHRIITGRPVDRGLGNCRRHRHTRLGELKGRGLQGRTARGSH